MIRQAILIDQNSISFIEGVVRRGRVDLRAFVRLPKGKFGDSATGDPEFGSPEEPGALLREELERLGWKPSSAMVILSSPSIIDRPLTLPRTPHAALPGVVKLQVEAMSMLKFQNPVCDFSVHRSDRQTMDLAVAITSESTVNQVVTRLGQSGFGVQSVVSVAHTMLTAIQHIPGKDQFNLFLLASDRRIDLMAVQDGKVVASHAELIFGLSTPVSDLLYPVVARFIKAVQRKDERFNPTQALLICDEPSWSENVRDRLEQEHEVASQVFDYRMLFHVDSQAVPNQRSEQLCAESLLLAGALMSQHQPRAERMDLSNPKQPKSRRVLKAFYAATARGLLVAPTGGMSTVARLDLIRSLKATVLFCTPSYALHLAEKAVESQIETSQLGVRWVIVAGEPGGSIPSIRHRIETAWGATVIDHSGASEVGPWGFGDSEGRGLFVNESDFIAEFISIESGEPAGEGELSELVLTSLGRWGSPVVRYRTGDLVRPSWSHESECRFVFLEGGVLSRSDDMMIIRGVNIFPSSVEQILRSFPEVVEYRLTAYKSGAMDGLVVEIEDRLEQPQRVARELQLRLGLKIQVDCVPLGTLPRFEAKGKRFVDERN